MRECPLWGKEEIPGNRIGITLIRHKELIHQSVRNNCDVRHGFGDQHITID